MNSQEIYEYIKKNKYICPSKIDELISELLKQIEVSDSNDTLAMNNLGILYNDKKDTKKSEEWFLKSANLGHNTAIFNLGLIFYNKKDYVKAEEWFRKANFESLDLGNNYTIYKDIHKKVLLKNRKLIKVYDDINTDPCNICYEQLLGSTSGINILRCGHAFHTECLKEQKCCPNCRQEL